MHSPRPPPTYALPLVCEICIKLEVCGALNVTFAFRVHIRFCCLLQEGATKLTPGKPQCSEFPPDPTCSPSPSGATQACPCVPASAALSSFKFFGEAHTICTFNERPPPPPATVPAAMAALPRSRASHFKVHNAAQALDHNDVCAA